MECWLLTNPSHRIIFIHASCVLQGGAPGRRTQGPETPILDSSKCSLNQCPITRVKGNGWTNEKHTDYKEKLLEFQRSYTKGISSFSNAACEEKRRIHYECETGPGSGCVGVKCPISQT